MLLLAPILRRQAHTRGQKTAYVVGTERVPYADFHRRANQLARALRRLGVARGDRVAVLAQNRVEYPVVYFGVLTLGAIVVPLNTRFTASEVGWVLGHSEAETLLIAAEFAPLLAEVRATTPLPHLRRVIAIDAPSADEPRLADLLAAESADEVAVDVDESDPHVMLYTSGTTGSAKGALLSQRSYYLQAVTSHLQLGFDEDDIALSMFPMFHMGGWALPLGFWHTGGTAVIMPKADPRAMMAAIERERVTYLYAVPTVFNSMLALADFERFDISSLRQIGSGTAAMTAEQVKRIIERFRCPRMYILYGSTEGGPISVLRPRDVARRPESVGRPYLDVELRLLDEEGADVGPGEAGEIAVRSEFTMRAYWHNPEETARTLRDGWVVTGDLGAFDADGFLSIVGRRKEVIRSGGESIFPVEIERVLAIHPQVREASVIGVPDPHWGEAVAVAVVLKAGAVLSEDEVIAHVRAHLAGFKKPRYVCFLDELPRTASSQQVRKPLLREIILERIAARAAADDPGQS